MPVTNLDDFECSDSFIINFTGVTECTFVPKVFDDPGDSRDPNVAVKAVAGRTTFAKHFIFTRGSNTAGVFDEHVAWSATAQDETVSNTVNTPPTGVTFNGAFNVAPDFSVPALTVQPVVYSGNINVTNFEGKRFTATVTVGFDPP